MLSSAFSSLKLALKSVSMSTIIRPIMRTVSTRTLPLFAAQNSRFMISNKPTTPAIVNAYRHFQINRAALQQVASNETKQLREQRKYRPLSPHLTIYEPQLTWYMSGLHRLTGCAIGGAVYLSSLAYLVYPAALGYSIDINTALAAFSALPEYLKFSAKTLVAAPFVYHASNGIRHLVWDSGKCLNMRGVYRTGYAVLAATALGTLCFASL